MTPTSVSGTAPGASAGDPDRDTLRRASLKVALRISAGVAVLVVLLLAAATVFLMNKLAHPSLPDATAGKAYTYLDSKDLIEGMILAGLAGIVLAGVVGWVSARSAIRPLGEALARQRRFVQDASHEPADAPGHPGYAHPAGAAQGRTRVRTGTGPG
ncbi:hypothetical protein NG819_07730 [Pseudarthrobacter sp. Fe7]|nr:hypothetical protein NG819_07730 [Pseudarthrobacter sp. Fe7]